ncbi:MAG: hypothetical protein RLZZ292_2836 [Bacteroidota bacterium]|jgi:septum formation protein
MKKLILASQSPRRHQLLREGGFEFEIRVPDVVEDYPSTLMAEEVPLFLARKKALAAATQFEIDDDTIIIASDCVVILNDVIYGKPTDYDDAVRILNDLSGKMHQVITGVCLYSNTKEETFAGISNVYMDRLTAEEIHDYITRCKPYDKAGSYAIQEWIGLCKISRIEGTYSNIMGLPMDLVYRHLNGMMSYER